MSRRCEMRGGAVVHLWVNSLCVTASQKAQPVIFSMVRPGRMCQCRSDYDVLADGHGSGYVAPRASSNCPIALRGRQDSWRSEVGAPLANSARICYTVERCRIIPDAAKGLEGSYCGGSSRGSRSHANTSGSSAETRGTRTCSK